MLKIDFSVFDNEFADVTNANIFDNYKEDFNEDSLYSQRIFGPIKDYECKCGHLSGLVHEGEICEKCNVKNISFILQYQ